MNRQSNRNRESNDPTEKQLALIEKLGGDPGEAFTRAEASELIDDLTPPATEAQLDFLEDLGYNFAANGEPNKYQASKLIDQLVEKRDAA